MLLFKHRVLPQHHPCLTLSQGRGTKKPPHTSGRGSPEPSLLTAQPSASSPLPKDYNTPETPGGPAQSRAWPAAPFPSAEGSSPQAHPGGTRAASGREQRDKRLAHVCSLAFSPGRGVEQQIKYSRVCVSVRVCPGVFLLQEARSQQGARQGPAQLPGERIPRALSPKRAGSLPGAGSPGMWVPGGQGDAGWLWRRQGQRGSTTSTALGPQGLLWAPQPLQGTG